MPEYGNGIGKTFSGATFAGPPPPDEFIRERILKPYADAIPVGKIVRWHRLTEARYHEDDLQQAEIMLTAKPATIPPFKWIQLPERHEATWRLKVVWEEYHESLEIRLYTMPSFSIQAKIKLPKQVKMGFAVDMVKPPLPEGFIDELVTWLEGA